MGFACLEQNFSLIIITAWKRKTKALVFCVPLMGVVFFFPLPKQQQQNEKKLRAQRKGGTFDLLLNP